MPAFGTLTKEGMTFRMATTSGENSHPFRWRGDRRAGIEPAGCQWIPTGIRQSKGPKIQRTRERFADKDSMRRVIW
jgi:hypothetical protein